MSIVAVTAAAGTGGVTSTAAALALTWPASVLLVEADPAGGDLGAWWDIAASPSSLVSTVSTNPSSCDEVFAHGQVFTRGLSVLVAPIRSNEAAVTVSAAAGRVLPLLSAGVEVQAIVDAGRSVGALAGPVAQSAVTVVVARQVAGFDRATAAVLERTGDVLDQCNARAIPTVVALIGDDPYRASVVEDYLGARTVALPADPIGNTALQAGEVDSRAWTRSKLAGATVGLVGAVRDALSVAVAAR